MSVAPADDQSTLATAISSRLEPSLSAEFEFADESLWDAIVIGAGTAGAVAAILFAVAGKSVLLVETKSFPRNKVCGGCLNQRAWRLLEQLPSHRGREQLSLTTQIMDVGSLAINRLHLACLNQTVVWSLPEMQAVSRYSLDQLLVRQAQACGAKFSCETTAKVIADGAIDFRKVRLKSRTGKTFTIRARVVIAADGLSHPSLADIPDVRSQVATGSRVGIGATFDYSSSCFAPGLLTMAVGQQGYVGVTRVERNRLNVAAAVDASALKSADGPGQLLNHLLRQGGLPELDDVQEIQWTGTPPLTRRSLQVAQRRLLLVGDAAGYIEPFTGEGMSWAIHSAGLASRLLLERDELWHDQLAAQWQRQWQRQVRSHQAACRALSALLKHPRLASLSLMAARQLPWLPQLLMRNISGGNERLEIGTHG